VQGRARSFTTGALAEDYLRLCRDPMRDLQRWMDEDKKKGSAGRDVQLTTRREDHAQTTTTANTLAQIGGLRSQPLHAVQGRLDADRAERRRADGLLARPRAGAGRYDGLQSVRADAGAAAGLTDSGGEAAAGASFRLGIELDAVSSYYAAKIAAVKRGLSPRDIAGAVRAILDEQAGAVRAVLEKWNAARAMTAKGKMPKAPSEARGPVRPPSGRQPS
jgi:hypothetical protein